MCMCFARKRGLVTRASMRSSAWRVQVQCAFVHVRMHAFVGVCDCIFVTRGQRLHARMQQRLDVACLRYLNNMHT